MPGNVFRVTSIVLSVCLLPALALAQPSTARVTRQTVVLEQPRGDSLVVTRVQPGTIVELLEVRGSWYRVSLPPTGPNERAVTGWLNRLALEPVTPGRSLPRPAVVAGDRPAPATAQTAPRRIGARAYFAADVERMTAKKSFDAIFGTPTLLGFGAGFEALNIWNSLFARVAVTRETKTGSRVFVFNGQPISLNIPLTVKMTPVELGGGWRRPSGGVVPYVGAAGLFLRYSESSSFAEEGENISRTHRGYAAFGGVDIALTKGVIVGAEAQYRGVPHALGSAPVSQEFGETDLGGFGVRILFGYKR
jgi:hypothetical protein